MISDKERQEAIRVRYNNWMDQYEQFLIKHNTHLNRLHEHEREEYMQTHNLRDTFLMNCKFEIQQHLNSNPVQMQAGAKARSHRSGSSSSVSSKRLEAEERRVELEAKKQALKKKREIEMAKVALQLEEEELKIQTDIAVADAKVRVYDEFERGEIGTSMQPAELKIETEQVKPFEPSQLSPHAETFLPVKEKTKDKLDFANLPPPAPASEYQKQNTYRPTVQTDTFY